MTKLVHYVSVVFQLVFRYFRLNSQLLNNKGIIKQQLTDGSSHFLVSLNFHSPRIGVTTMQNSLITKSNKTKQVAVVYK